MKNYYFFCRYQESLLLLILETINLFIISQRFIYAIQIIITTNIFLLTWFCKKNCWGLSWLPDPTCPCCNMASCCNCWMLWGFWKACRLPNIWRGLLSKPLRPPSAARVAPTPELELVTWEFGDVALVWSPSPVTCNWQSEHYVKRRFLKLVSFLMFFRK